MHSPFSKGGLYLFLSRKEDSVANIIIVITDPKEARAAVKSLGEKSPVIGEIELHVFRGAPLYVLQSSAGKVLSLNVTYSGKRNKNIWEPYANWYTGYTPSILRRRGYATQLYQHVEKLAIAFGCRRLKSLAGTQLGLLLHASLGHHIWGITARLEVSVDTPLCNTEEYLSTTKGRVPLGVLQTLKDTLPEPCKPISVAEVRRRLRGADLKYERPETKEQVTL